MNNHYILLLLTTTLLSLCNAHSYLTSPIAYNLQFRTRYCKGAECFQACPTEYNSGMANNVTHPAATWQRGETVNIRWVRNNHRGGFVRLALVPVGVLMDREWHTKLAFLHGCWSSGETDCQANEECGTDKFDVVYARDVTIPNCYPDGSYVLGMAWYGGVRRDESGFADFYSCSHIRIRGGQGVQSECPALWEPGTGEGVRDGKCRTIADELGDCGSSGCGRRPVVYTVPKARGGTVRRQTVEEVLGLPSPGVEGGREGLTFSERFGGICTGSVCCDKRCGSCGGVGCAKRLGGKEGCCGGEIIRSGRACGNGVEAPCYIVKGTV